MQRRRTTERSPALIPLQQLEPGAWAQVVGVFTDIDDTLTSEGAITPEALAALHQLQRAGLTVIAVTGRPVGWSEPFARVWPVDAIVAENGAVALIPDDLNKNGLQRPRHERKQLSKIK